MPKRLDGSTPKVPKQITAIHWKIPQGNFGVTVGIQGSGMASFDDPSWCDDWGDDPRCWVRNVDEELLGLSADWTSFRRPTRLLRWPAILTRVEQRRTSGRVRKPRKD